MNNCVSLVMAKKLKKAGWIKFCANTYHNGKVRRVVNGIGRFIDFEAPTIAELLDELPRKIYIRRHSEKIWEVEVDKLKYKDYWISSVNGGPNSLSDILADLWIRLKQENK